MKQNGWSLLLYALVALSNQITAQIQFTEKLPPLIPSGTFSGYEYGGIEVGDIENDGIDDVIFHGVDYIGMSIGYGQSSYSNDGNGVFSTNLITNQNICLGQDGDLKILDINGDGEDDIATSGSGCGAAFYERDVNGLYQVVFGFGFSASLTSNFRFADFDLDNDLDVLLIESGFAEIKAFRNDGGWNFTEIAGGDFSNYNFGGGPDIELADLNGDNYPDLVLLEPGATRVMINNGAGVFTIDASAGLAPFSLMSDIQLGDIDNDGDNDCVLLGKAANGWPDSKVYLNDGNGNFVESPSSMPAQFNELAFTFSDIDGDVDLDIVAVGSASSRVYTNNGSGVFVENTASILPAISKGAVELYDVDNDGDQDLFMSGGSPTLNGFLFENNGSGVFTEVPFTNLEIDPVRYGDILYLDIENDGDEDVLLCGENKNQAFTELYINDGAGNLQRTFDNIFPDILNGSLAAADVNLDGYTDVLISGEIDVYPAAITQLFLNDGTGSFTPSITQPFQKLHHGESQFEDIDNDGDPDLLISGDSLNIDPYLMLYVNDGSGNFSEVNSGISMVGHSTADFFDANGDNFLDLVISGYNQPFENWSYFLKTEVYMNDGAGNFILTPNPDLLEVFNGDIDHADIDNDGDEDLIIQGVRDLSWCIDSAICQVYLNDGNGIFSEDIGNVFPAEWNGSVDFEDMDNDGDPDLLVTGSISSGLMNPFAAIYENDGTGNFSQVLSVPLDSINLSTTEFTDLNNDGKVDFVISGMKEDLSSISKIYLNQSNVGVSKIELQPEISIYPNPTDDGILFIDYVGEIGGVEVMDMTGRFVSALITVDNKKVDASRLSAGNYLLQVMTSKGTVVKEISIIK